MEEVTGLISFLFAPGWSMRKQLEGRMKKLPRELSDYIAS